VTRLKYPSSCRRFSLIQAVNKGTDVVNLASTVLLSMMESMGFLRSGFEQSVVDRKMRNKRRGVGSRWGIASCGPVMAELARPPTLPGAALFVVR
jgi:hypothetical protein